MITLTYTDIVEGLARLGASHPDHVGHGDAHGSPGECRYVYPDNTRCVVGQVLHGLGVPDDVLAEGVGDAIELLDDLERAEVIRWAVPADREPAQSLLFRAQAEQDGGAPWRRAVEAAFDGSVWP